MNQDPTGRIDHSNDQPPDPPDAPGRPATGAPQSPPPDPSQSAPAASTSNETYGVVEPEPRPSTASVLNPLNIAPPGARGAAPAPQRSGRAVVEKPGLLSGFDEDADFERDPELERARRGGSSSSAVSRSTGPRRKLFGREIDEDLEPFVKPGLGDERVMAIAGVVLLVAAIITVLINAPVNLIARALLVTFQCFVHTATGLAAVGAATAMLGRPLGSAELAVARMFAAVGLFQFLVNLNLMLLSSRVDEIVVAALAYVLALWLLFRRPIDQILVIAGFHFLGWLAVFITGQLYIWAANPAVPVAPGAPGAG